MPKKEWLPILNELGEDVVARIIDRSPDVKSALLEAKGNFDKAVEEGQALRKRGHEGDDVDQPGTADSEGGAPEPPPPGSIDSPGRGGG